jgi:hypothetical protein
LTLRVTDHAVLRYLERVKGFDVEAVRTHIALVCTPGHAAGANCIKAEGVKFEITNNAVVTCAPGKAGFSDTKRVKIALRAKFAQVQQGAR